MADRKEQPEIRSAALELPRGIGMQNEGAVFTGHMSLYLIVKFNTTHVSMRHQLALMDITLGLVLSTPQ